MEIFGWVLLGLAILCVLLALLRFVTVRSRGASVVMRVLPASGVHGWRHGKVQYAGDTMKYFKLRSLLPKADLVLDRTHTHLESHREPTAQEKAFMPEVTRVLELISGEKKYEVAAPRHGAMALVSWIESAPDARQEKTDHRALSQRIGRTRQHG